MRKERNVLLALGYYDHRFHIGVARYAREHHWHVVADLAYHRDIPDGWRGDGIIAKLVGNDDLSRFVAKARVPVVNVGRGINRRWPLVLIDEPAVVALALEHFLARGFERFAWAGPSPEKSDRARLFCRELHRRRLACTILERQPTGAWINQLKALTKPVAVFCWDDTAAARVIQACRAEALAVPEDVAVLGINNDSLVCEALPVPLSSIDTDMEGRAYLAAALLDKEMDGRRIPHRTLVPPRCLVTRKSTDILAVPHTEVAKALRFIHDNLSQPLTVAAVARAAALSPRGLHKAFVRHLGRTPLREIHRMRLEQACKLLRETSEKVAVIAEKTGYGPAKNMFRAFRRQSGTTPTQYRQSAR